MKISVILPTFNESIWLKETLDHVIEELQRADVINEVIVVDDGSTDSTKSIVELLRKNKSSNIKYTYQKNAGRFLARKKGLELAKYEFILLLDSRVHIDKGAIKYVVERISKNPEELIWNAHIHVNKKGNFLASFWDVITNIAWRRYFKNPRHLSYGLDEFDYYPKGTTCFLTKKSMLQEAMDSFATNSKDLKRSNDDTLIIKSLNEKNKIHISPKFSATYFARNTFKKFFLHAYHRGQVFEDGFLRPGNRFFVPLLAFLMLSFTGTALFVYKPHRLMLIVLAFTLLFILACLVVSRVVRVRAITWRDSLVFSLLSVPFAVFYGAGIWRAFLRRIVGLYEKRVPTKIFSISWLIFPLVLYSFFAFRYMSPVMSNCTTMVTAPGDGTAGLVARYNASPDSPLWGFTTKLSTPFGENLNQPTNFSAPLFYTAYWVVAKATGPVCALNLLNFSGYVLSAIVMCAFVYWLLRNKYISVLAGYAVSFSPYFQSKVAGHPSYGFQLLLITLLWLTLQVYRSSKKRWIMLLGLNAGILAYWDPYFVLLGMAVLFPAILTLLVVSVRRRKNHIQLFKRYVLAGLLASIVILPVAYIRVTQSSKIESLVASGRNDIKFDAYAYSNRPIEYLLPAEKNPYINSVFGEGYQKINRHYSNPGEYTVGLSLTIMSLLACFAVIVLWNKLSSNDTQLNFGRMRISPKIILSVCIAVGLTSFLLALPPRYGPLRNLSDYLTDYITMWRVLSRLFVVINIVFILSASVALLFFNEKVRSRFFKVSIFALIFIGVFIEYQGYPHASRSWSYIDNVSPVYKRLKERSDIQEIAEYPLDLKDQMGMLGNYLTFQKVHDKSLLNGIYLSDKLSSVQLSLADLSGPQTVRVLASLGIDAVVVHGKFDMNAIPEGLTLIDEDAPQLVDNRILPVRLFKIRPDIPKVDEFTAVLPGDKPVEIRYDALEGKPSLLFEQNVLLQNWDLDLNEKSSPMRMCFQLSSTAETAETNLITESGSTMRVLLTNKPQEIETEASEVKIEIIDSDTKSAVYIDKLGC